MANYLSRILSKLIEVIDTGLMPKDDPKYHQKDEYTERCKCPVGR